MNEIRYRFYFVVFLFFVLLPLFLYIEHKRHSSNFVEEKIKTDTPCTCSCPTVICPAKEDSVKTNPPKDESPKDIVSPWDFSKPYKLAGEACMMVPVQPHLPDIVPRFTQCVRRRPDVVSNEIRSLKRWRGCDNPINLLLESNPSGLFLDVGANIGSCSIMALAAGARVVAFEPLPSNIYYFHESVALLDAKWRERLVLWPVALGAERKEETIYTENGNAGNSALEFPTRAKRENSNKVQVIRLDDIFYSYNGESTPLKIDVLKMDVQGYEIHVLEGAKRLLQEKMIKVIQTEVSTEWLKNLGRKPSELCALLWKSGFELFEETCVGTGRNSVQRGRGLTEKKCKEWDGMNAECDIIARLKE